MRRILLINPWITDVAAYDLWAWPLGLLYWGGRLRSWGFKVDLIDCTDRAHPALASKSGRPGRFHTGKYRSEPYDEQPEPCRRAKRMFRRYGLTVDAFEDELVECQVRLGGPPDAIFVTSRMTYWYHGVRDAVARCRARWEDTPILLGGIYATLCPKHAHRHTKADFVVEGDGLTPVAAWLRERFPDAAERISTPSHDPENWPLPAFDLCHNRRSLPLATSIGCPFRCSYCASTLLVDRFRRRSPDSVARELIEHSQRWGTTDFVFYDDALLVDAPKDFEPFLDRVIDSGIHVRFHVPNGLHYWMIGPRLAGKMRSAGFETIRMSLETVRDESLQAWGRPGEKKAFRDIVAALRDCGFSRAQLGVYIMAGMPGQTTDEVRDSIDAVASAGATPYLNEFSPIPGTAEWARVVEISGSEIADEPLWHNNSLYRTRPEAPLHKEFESLKEYAISKRREPES
ncbi:radical SAM protein [Candidatus Sumerlaeota bacterium]|nr:radical SAM protein [Candidatus Sumerlaeota bacterium]